MLQLAADFVVRAETFDDGTDFLQDLGLKTRGPFIDIILLTKTVQGIQAGKGGLGGVFRLEAAETGPQLFRGGKNALVFLLFLEKEFFHLAFPGPEIQDQRGQDSQNQQRQRLHPDT